jgi:hypothetical protein
LSIGVDERRVDRRPRLLACGVALLLAAQQLQQRQRGVVERHHHRAADAVRPPLRLDQIGALYR